MITGLILSALSGFWARLTGWAALTAALATTLGLAWLRGRAAGKAAWQQQRQAAREQALRTSGEILHDVQNDSDAGLDRRLDRWMRD